MRALKRYNPRPSLDFQNPEQNGLCEAELWLIRVLTTLEWHQKNKKECWSDKLEKSFRQLRSIGRGLKLYPLPEWAEKAVAVLNRIEGADVLPVEFYAEMIRAQHRHTKVQARAYIDEMPQETWDKLSEVVKNPDWALSPVSSTGIIIHTDAT